jgi:hypothetical protein
MGFIPGHIFYYTRGHVEEPTIVKPDREPSWQETLGVSLLITTANDHVWWMDSLGQCCRARFSPHVPTVRDISDCLPEKGSSVANSLERKIWGRILFVLLENA